MSALPSLQDELNRKAFQTMEWLSNASDKAKISEAQFSTGVDALFMATSGLVDAGILALVSQASQIAGKGSAEVKRHFIKGDTIVTLCWVWDDAQVTVTKRQNGARQKQQVSADSPAQARGRFNTMAQALLARGFEEL